MNKKLAKLGGIGVSAVLAAAALLAAPAAANAAIVPTVGSAHPLYLHSGEDGTQVPVGSALGWNADVFGSPDTSDENYDSYFTVPAAAGSVRTFIAPRGQETNQAAWNASGPLGFTPSGIQLPNLRPSLNTQAGTGSPSGSGAVANAGGDYSLGIAFLSNSTVVEANFTFITVTANANPALATWTFATPAAAAVAPVITTTSLDALTSGAAFTQTLAATGTAPITWAVQAGALPAGLALDTATGVVSGTATAAGAYSFTLRATNTAGGDDQAFTGSVSAPAPSSPTQPTGADSGKQTIAAPAAGATTITLPAGAANKNKTLDVWAWSTPTKIGQVTTDATTGDAVIDITSLPAGSHTVALVAPGDATFAVLSWGTFDKLSASGDQLTDTVDLTATVTASDLWSLNAEKTLVDFGNVARGATKTAALGKVTVVDDRDLLKGWNLTAAASPFVKGTDTIPASALAIAPAPFLGTTLQTGITTGTTGAAFASSTPVSTGTTGALFDAGLSFTAPDSAQSGVYTSTLTLTLTSK